MATRWKPQSATGSRLKSPESSPDSSPTPSFRTASETADRDDDVVTTAKTSPNQFNDKPRASAPDTPMQGPDDLEDMAEEVAKDVVLPPYRPAKKLPREVREHCKIFLEEELYGAAIEMLGSLMSAGGHRPRSKQRQALVPPPNQIAFLASLAIHPLYTNRPTEVSHRIIGSQAMQYLRGLLGSVGPVHANFRAALDFEPWRRQGRRAPPAAVENESNEEDEAMGGRFAPSHIVFSKAESFWRLLGWAFNCSALHPERWKYWEVWLGFMADVLDADYRERESLDDRGTGANDWRHGSLLLRYVRDLDRSAVKGMVRALFADGSAASLREFPELYDREAKVRTDAGNKRKRAPSSDLDLANDKFGDYFDDDDDLSSQGSCPDSPSRPTAGPRRKRMEEAAPPLSEELVASVSLRLRFFDIVGKAFDFLDNVECQTELFAAFSASLRSLPVPLYELYVAPHRAEMDVRAQASLLFHAAGTFHPTSAPKPSKVDKAAAEAGFINMLVMEKCYLPFAATSTAEGNAKFSLVLESLLRIYWVKGQVCYSADLEEAVRTGVALRNDRSKPKKSGRSKDRAEEAARKILAQSGSRLEYLIEIVREEDQADGDMVAE
ncbi:hypothetical protein MAPG_08321 [Magnaporthiopsis poae ATCC 64411]|uniref:Uncharacterized protein n=1 Tax=Magnaporthiopsis poae (strain ATCC 64411 / 73-15) TaxID=644358 RepID=A0A0C4E721_MAGP6|nr:hypothetical protein MAPG_08321 [Magnaporthiopsis poae ATCC 64411]